MIIITHRGIDRGRKNYFTESSREAFADHISHGFGLEFDLQFTKDNQIVIFHDDNLKRLSGGQDTRNIRETDKDEFLSMQFNGSRTVSFSEPLVMIQSTPQNHSIHAVHVKSRWQEKMYLDSILKELETIENKQFILFDLKPEAAHYLKTKNSKLSLAPSVAHPYDIERFNVAVGGTLLPLEEAIKNRDIYSWVWLDEWDRTDKDGGVKSLYTEAVFKTVHDKKMKIALVMPELHATSPGLLGSERHQDAQSMEILRKRMEEIIALKPDAVCTDYPNLVKQLSTL